MAICLHNNFLLLLHSQISFAAASATLSVTPFASLSRNDRERSGRMTVCVQSKQHRAFSQNDSCCHVEQPKEVETSISKRLPNDIGGDFKRILGIRFLSS